MTHSMRAMRHSYPRTRFRLAEQAQFTIAAESIFWQTISHDFVFHRRQLLKQAG